jgi:hypothetical protein
MLDSLARRLLLPINTSVIGILGMFNVLLGFWIVLPFRSLGQNYSSEFFPEWFLGSTTLAIGALIVYGAFKENLKILSIGTVVGFFFWFVAMVLLLITHWASPGWIVGLMIAAYCGFVHLNISVNNKNLRNKK